MGRMSRESVFSDVPPQRVEDANEAFCGFSHPIPDNVHTCGVWMFTPHSGSYSHLGGSTPLHTLTQSRSPHLPTRDETNQIPCIAVARSGEHTDSLEGAVLNSHPQLTSIVHGTPMHRLIRSAHGLRKRVHTLSHTSRCGSPSGVDCPTLGHRPGGSARPAAISPLPPPPPPEC